jgi:uncharacterized protein YcbK (DUF882 family)
VRWEHYIPLFKKRWPNFSPKEVASKGDGTLLIDEHALDCLQKARDIAGKPLIINCGYRDELHNALVGGAPRSYHLEGRAFDISLRGFTKAELIKICEQAGFTGFGVNYSTFLHVDTGRKRRF